MRVLPFVFAALAGFTYLASTSCSDVPTQKPTSTSTFMTQYQTGPRRGMAVVGQFQYSNIVKAIQVSVAGVNATSTSGTITSSGVDVLATLNGITYTIHCPTAPATATASASDGSTGTGDVVVTATGDQIYLATGSIPSGTYLGQTASILFLMHGGQPTFPSINIGGTLASSVTANLGSAPGTVNLQGLFGVGGTIGANVNGVGSPTGSASVFGQAGTFTLPSMQVW